MSKLVIAGERGCSSDQLITAIWRDPPQTARKGLHNSASELRKLLSDDDHTVLANTPTGYALRLGRDEIDVTLFEDLVAEGRELLRNGHDEVGTDKLEKGIQLWTGEPFEGCDDIAEGHCAFLTGEFLEASLELARIWIGRGDFTNALRLAQKAQEIDQYDERLFRVQLQAMAAGGRRLESHYRDFEALIERDLGASLEPATETLFEQLTSEAGSERVSPAKVAASVTPETKSVSLESAEAESVRAGRHLIDLTSFEISESTLVGRAVERERIEKFLDSSHRLLSVAGAPGIGKSVLVKHALAQARDRGITPIDLGSVDHRNVMGILPHQTGADDQHDAFMDIAGQIMDMPSALVAINNLDSANDEAIAVIGEILATRPYESIQLVVSYKPDWTGDSAELWRQVEATLAKKQMFTAIDLRPMSDAEVAEMAELALGAPQDAEWVRTIAEDSGGSPRLASELIQAGYRQGDPLPVEVSRLVMGAISHLPTESREAIELFAAMAPSIDLAGLPAVPGLDAAVDAGLEAQLLREERGSHELRFVSPVVGRAIYEDISRTRRQELHTFLARELRGRASQVRSAARHALFAEASLPTDEVYEIVRAAAVTAADRSDPHEATNLYLNALRLHRLVHPEDEASYTALVVELYRCVDDVATPEVMAAWEHAVDGSLRSQDPEMVARLAESRLDRWIGGNHRFVDLLRSAIEWCAPDDDATRARLSARLAVELAESAPGSETHRLAADAAATARSIGDSEGRVYATRAELITSYGQAPVADRIATAKDLSRRAAALLDDDHRMLGLVYEAYERITNGERTTVLPTVEQVLQIAQARKRPRYEALATSIKICLADAADDGELAESYIAEMERLQETSTNRNVPATTAGHRAMQLWTRGEHGFIRDRLAQSFRKDVSGIHRQFQLASSYTAVGEAEAGWKLISDLRPSVLPWGTFYSTCLAFGVDTVVGARVTDAAQEYFDALEGFKGQTILAGGAFGLFGPVASFQAELAALMGDSDLSIELFDEADKVAEAAGDVRIAERLTTRRKLTLEQ